MSNRRAIAPEIEVFPLTLGTNVFGWTADKKESQAVLDAYVTGGGNFIDTADSYSFWAPGNSGGESESIIGAWLSGRPDRDDLVIATKVSQHPDYSGMAPMNIRAAIDASLKRLGVDTVDLYYAHFDDESTPLLESIAAMSALVDEGKIRAIGVSNYTSKRIEEWLSITALEGFHAPVAIQPMYSLVERGIEADILPLARENSIGVMPYYALARGFLTGKYSHGATIDSPRADAAAAYLDPRGRRVLDALGHVADRQSAPQASIALAWLAAQPGVVAPIASARNTEQLSALLRSAEIQLSDDELRILTEASDPNIG